MEQENKEWSRSQRMQLKAWICVLGFGLIIVLLGAKLVSLLAGQEPDEVQPPVQEEPHIPVVGTLVNVWILEEGEEGIVLFRDGQRESYPYGQIMDGNGVTVAYRPERTVREQVADVTLTDGAVTDIQVKAEKINGRILSATQDGIEVEGYGRIPLAEDYKGYRLYDRLEMCTAADLPFGYDFADFCLEDGEICGILLVKELVMEHIRVLVKASDYSSLLHTGPVLTSDTPFTVVYGTYPDRKTESHQAWEEITFGYGSPYFEEDRVWVIPDVLTGKVILKNVNRVQGVPSYRGQMELIRTEEGIAVVNEVLLEEYLYSVVPSEMPSVYPMEALKAQAVCARTYAYGRMLHAGYPQYGAHVDDSTSYQVYNNVLEDESTTTAVKETYGQLLYTAEGALAETFYYSTSCGMGSEATVWKTAVAPTLTYLQSKPLSRTAMEQTLTQASVTGPDPGEALQEEEVFAAFITGENPDDFEYYEGWYRWSYQVEELDPGHILTVLQKRYAANSDLILTWKDGAYVSEPIQKLGDITDLYVEKRGSGGVADELVIEAGKQKIKVITEHNIRYVLNNGSSVVDRKDGSQIASPNLLPSGFFVMEIKKEKGKVTGYTLRGGGFGHGVGMSQNGARQMAQEGYSAMDILLFFYQGCTVENVYTR